ncbi:isochorismatase family protein [Paenibacillus sp. YPG26]|uniref:isochorismatase family protein n=1 Tax=Paenibacillus sp. YPG26 TaxID=2878915 RepID=UPI00203E09C3|nr:isochorismatase family protein [Paenibacillus sp. YPG26]USB32699.1 isochorismatase family protein [Paenibacillus sp. YPG26]
MKIKLKNWIPLVGVLSLGLALYTNSIGSPAAYAKPEVETEAKVNSAQELKKKLEEEPLTPENSVILLVDHQLGLMQGIRDIESLDEYKNNVIAMAKVAKAFNIPVILSTSVDSGPNGKILPDLPKILPNAPLIQRPGVINAYDWPEFRQALEKTGRKKVIIAAVTLETCVMFPTLEMEKDGYDVYPVVDASGSWSKLAGEAAMQRMTKAGANLTSWPSVLCELQADWRKPTAAAAAQIFHDHLATYGFLMDTHANYTQKK